MIRALALLAALLAPLAGAWATPCGTGGPAPIPRSAGEEAVRRWQEDYQRYLRNCGITVREDPGTTVPRQNGDEQERRTVPGPPPAYRPRDGIRFEGQVPEGGMTGTPTPPEPVGPCIMLRCPGGTVERTDHALDRDWLGPLRPPQDRTGKADQP